jgi:CubicO group peptidase (beta-lactamase class C family)
MAKLGQLLLTGGNWDGKQIVPSEWIGESIAPQIGDPKSLAFCGYQWWLGRSLVKAKEAGWVFATGHGGQRVYVVPECDLVMILTAGLLRQFAAILGASKPPQSILYWRQSKTMPHQNRLEVETQSRCWTSWRDAVHT